MAKLSMEMIDGMTIDDSGTPNMLVAAFLYVVWPGVMSPLGSVEKKYVLAASAP